MREYERYILRVKNSPPAKREKRIFDIFVYLGSNVNLSNEVKIIFRDYLLEIYPKLNFDEKHAAIQALMKAGNFYNEREIVFDYLRQVFEKFHVDSQRLINYLFVIEKIDGVDKERDIWDLTSTFRDAYEILQSGKS